MKLKNYFFIILFLFCFSGKAQRIANYVSNGSFEEYYNCSVGQNYGLTNVKYWSGIDSLCHAGLYYAVCNSKVPVSNVGYQYPRTGEAHILSIFYYLINDIYQIAYLKNRLKSNLQAGRTYCVTFHVNIEDISTYGIDGFGAYFGDDSIDTINYCNIPLVYLTPQVQNPHDNIITDTMNWTPVTGTFVANGTEKFLLLGNFLSNDSVNTLMINPTSLPAVFTEAFIDDVSCIPINLEAYAGRDTTIYLNDSIYIGRENDFAIDSGCVWYKLPSTTAIDTTSGKWVKPALGTHTYVVRQELECSGEKWDTVVVNVREFDVGVEEYARGNLQLTIYPNPVSQMLNVNLTTPLSKGEGAESDFQIINVLGNVILSQKIDLKKGKVEINLSDLETGMYFIKVGNSVRKFVKE